MLKSLRIFPGISKITDIDIQNQLVTVLCQLCQIHRKGQQTLLQTVAGHLKQIRLQVTGNALNQRRFISVVPVEGHNCTGSLIKIRSRLYQNLRLRVGLGQQGPVGQLNTLIFQWLVLFLQGNLHHRPGRSFRRLRGYCGSLLPCTAAEQKAQQQANQFLHTVSSGKYLFPILPCFCKFCNRSFLKKK